MRAGRFFVLVTVLAAVGLSACGRKGNLDTPYEAAVDARRQAERNNQPVPPPPAEPVRERPFILDRLL